MGRERERERERRKSRARTSSLRLELIPIPVITGTTTGRARDTDRDDDDCGIPLRKCSPSCLDYVVETRERRGVRERVEHNACPLPVLNQTHLHLDISSVQAFSY